MPKFFLSMLIAAAVALCPFQTECPEAGEYGSSGKFDFVKHKKKAAAGIHVPSDAQTKSYRTEYIEKAEKLSSEGKNIEACALIHKLSELILKKSDDMTREEWVFTYAQFYRESIALRNSYREKTESELMHSALKGFEQAIKARSSKRLQFKNPYEIPCKGSLSSDGRIFLSSSSSSAAQNKIPISAYGTGENKLWEEIPVPDDKKNPQIKRWGRAARTKMPKWSPDGQKYAYILNGALCASVKGRSEIISSVKDSAQENDTSFEWSSDGSSIAYIRNIGGTTYAFINRLSTHSDIRIGKADYAVPSPDGKKALYTSDGLIYIYEGKSKSGRLACGSCPVFSTDGHKAFFISGRHSIREISLKDRKERELISIKGKEISSIAPLSPDRLAFTLSGSGDLMILYANGKAETVAKNAGELDLSFPNSRCCILCRRKAIKFRQEK